MGVMWALNGELRRKTGKSDTGPGVAERHSTETRLRCYTQVDEATMLAVVSETRKVWAMGTKP